MLALTTYLANQVAILNGLAASGAAFGTTNVLFPACRLLSRPWQSQATAPQTQIRKWFRRLGDSGRSATSFVRRRFAPLLWILL